MFYCFSNFNSFSFFFGLIAKRKRLEEKKRRLPEGIANQNVSDKQKKKYREGGSPLSESDKSVLEHWNKIQQTLLNRSKEQAGGRTDHTNMEEFFQHQELLIKEQSEQLDKQQCQIMEQQRRLQQQTEQIRVLVHHQKVLIRECKASGMKIPLSTPNPSPLTPPFSNLSPNLTSKPAQPLTVNSSVGGGARPRPSSSSSSSNNNKSNKDLLPPNVIKPNLPNMGTSSPPPTSMVAPPLTTPSQSMALPPKNVHSETSTVITVTPPTNSVKSMPHPQIPYQSLPPPSLPQPHPSIPLAPPLMYPNSLSQYHHHVPPPSQVSMTTSDYMMSQYTSQQQAPPPEQQDPMMQYINQQPQLPPFTAPDFSGVFSPLTSKELMELTSQEIHNLSPCDPNSVGSFNPPFEDLDNFFSLPTGCGAGYGVGISEDDLRVTIPADTEV